MIAIVGEVCCDTAAGITAVMLHDENTSLCIYIYISV